MRIATRPIVLLVTAILVTLSAPARAQQPDAIKSLDPGDAPGGGLDPDTATTISAGLMGGALSATAMILSNNKDSVAGYAVGGFALFLAPSLGRVAGGDLSGTALHLGSRIVFPGAAFAGAYYFMHASKQGDPDQGDYATISGVAAGGAVMLGFAIWDVATTADDLRDKRHRRWAVMPMPVGEDGAPGVGVVGSF